MKFMFSTLTHRALSQEITHLVFFPGTGCTGRIFNKLAQEFSSKNVMIHYAPIHNQEHLNTIVSANIHQLTNILRNKKAIAVGHSLGGHIAAMTVEAAPDLFQGLVLCNTRYKPMSAADRQNKQAIIKKISRCSNKQFEELLCMDFFKHQEPSLTTEEAALLIQDAKSAGKSNFLQHLELSLQEHKMTNYSKILEQLPITVIQGEDDKIVSNSGWKECDLWNAPTQYPMELIHCPGGHLSILKHPKLIASKINEMIALLHEADPALIVSNPPK